jgi:hypothetical protein
MASAKPVKHGTRKEENGCSIACKWKCLKHVYLVDTKEIFNKVLKQENITYEYEMVEGAGAVHIRGADL